jgi:pilus assembly protein CpaC
MNVYGSLSFKEVFMRKERVLFILTVLIIVLFSSVSLAAIPVEVTAGKETILTLKKPSKRVSLANPEIATINIVSPTEVVLNGKKSGITSLIVWDKEGSPTFFDVIVYKERIAELDRARADALENKIKSVAPDTDVKVEMAGDTLVLAGTAKNRQIVDKIEKLAMLYATKGCKDVSRSGSLPRSSAEAMEQGKTETQGQGYISLNVAQQAMQQQPTTEEGPLCVLNLVTIPEAQQVILEIKVAQINKTKLKELGISYLIKDKNFELTAPGLFTSPDGKLGGAAGPTGGVGGTRGTVGTEVTPGIGGFDLGITPVQIAAAYFPSGVATVLKAIQEKGFGRVLAEPNLVVRSGETGTFHVGQKIPIQTVTGVGATATVGITYEDVGIRLNFAPEVLETGAIRLKIDPAEVSSVARYITFQGILAPEIDTRTVSTNVDLREGESLIIAGLLSEEMKKNIQKIPLLGDIPILGALFRSTRDELNDIELAFFITPRLSKPIPPGVKTKLPTDNRPTPAEEREFQWIPIPGGSSAPETGRAPEGTKSEPQTQSEETGSGMK